MASTVVTCPSCGTRSRVPAVAEGRPRCPACKNDLPWIASAEDESFAEVADSSRIPVLVDLWAPWCGPCRQLSPALEKLAGELAGKIKLVKVNVDNSPATQARFRVQAIPTMVLFRDGAEIDRLIGFMPKDKIIEKVSAKL